MRKRVRVVDLVSATDIAERTGVARPQVVHEWRRRHDTFPEPVHERPRSILWSWRDVEAWGRATGRL